MMNKGEDKMNEETLYKNFSKNLASIRKKSGLTQAELAEKLNYSDKSVSKWERGEGIPDLYNTVKIAELFGVTVSDLIESKEIKKPVMLRNRFIITVLSIGVSWLLAVILFFVFELFMPDFKSFIFFIYAVPVSCIVSVVFSAVWWNRICQFFSVSSLIWAVAMCVVITVNIPKIALIFTVAAVLQVMTVLWFLMKKQNK